MRTYKSRTWRTLYSLVIKKKIYTNIASVFSSIRSYSVNIDVPRTYFDTRYVYDIKRTCPKTKRTVLRPLSSDYIDPFRCSLRNARWNNSHVKNIRRSGTAVMDLHTPNRSFCGLQRHEIYPQDAIITTYYFIAYDVTSLRPWNSSYSPSLLIYA